MRLRFHHTTRRAVVAAAAAVAVLAVTLGAPAHAAVGDVTTIAGDGTFGFADANGTNARFSNPFGVAFGPDGNLYVAEYGGNRIRRVTPNGDVTTFAGSGTAGYLDANGTSAQFSNPTALAFGPDGNLYVSDYFNFRIRKIAPNGDVTTIAGDGSPGYLDANGTTAKVDRVVGLTVDRLGNVFLADSANSRIRKIATNGDVTTVAGSGVVGSADGNGINATFRIPRALAVEASGALLVAEESRIRRVAPNGDVTTIAGGPLGFLDANGTNARLFDPFGLAIDPSGIVYFTDSTNNRVRRLAPNGDVTTIAGSGVPGSIDGNGTAAAFNSPRGIVFDSAGNLLVSELSGNRIRRIQLAPPPAPAPIPQITIPPFLVPPSTSTPSTTAPAPPTNPAPPATTPPSTAVPPTTTTLPTTTAPAPSAITPATPILAEPDFTG